MAEHSLIERFKSQVTGVVMDEEPVPLPPRVMHMDFQGVCRELDKLEVNGTCQIERTLWSTRSVLSRYTKQRYRKDHTWFRRFTCRATDDPTWTRVWRIR